MARLLMLLFISLICSSLGSVDATSFECTDGVDACKAQFSTQFQKEFRELYLSRARELLATALENGRAILPEIPDDDAFKKTLEEIVNNVDDRLQKLNEVGIDEDKITETIKQAMDVVMYQKPGEPSQAMVEALERHNVKKALAGVMISTANDIIKLWTDMYAGVGEKDLKAYPEYTMVTDLFKAYKTDTTTESKATHFTGALEVLAKKFDMKFFDTIVGTVFS